MIQQRLLMTLEAEAKSKSYISLLRARVYIGKNLRVARLCNIYIARNEIFDIRLNTCHRAQYIHLYTFIIYMKRCRRSRDLLLALVTACCAWTRSRFSFFSLFSLYFSSILSHTVVHSLPRGRVGGGFAYETWARHVSVYVYASYVLAGRCFSPDVPGSRCFSAHQVAVASLHDLDSFLSSLTGPLRSSAAAYTYYIHLPVWELSVWTCMNRDCDNCQRVSACESRACIYIYICECRVRRAWVKWPLTVYYIYCTVMYVYIRMERERERERESTGGREREPRVCCCSLVGLLLGLCSDRD